MVEGLEHSMSPFLGGVNPIEGVDMEAMDVGDRIGQHRGQVDQKLVGAVSAGSDQLAGETLVFGQKLGGCPYADPQ